MCHHPVWQPQRVRVPFIEYGCFADIFFGISNVAEQLVEKGLASVVRHKRDDEDRSPDYDKLIAAEQASVSRFNVLRSLIF